MIDFYVIRLGVLAAVAFFVAFLISPLLTHFLYTYRCWKKTARTVAPDGSATPLFHALHKDREVKTPRLGGLLIWGTVLLIAFILWVLAAIFPDSFLAGFNFVNRSQTWIPLFTLAAAALLGLVDDILVIRGVGEQHKGAGIRFRHRALLVALIGLLGASWFYYKLGWDAVHVPFVGDWVIGLWYIPLFIVVMLVTFSGSVIDGIDGLSGGVFATIFAAYGAIAFARGQYDLATFCAVVAGATLAFLWYNIPPARYYMSETGILGLTATLAVLVFLTDTVFIFPLIAFILLVEIASNVIQLVSKRLFGRKVFLIAPIHHHYEAKGWPAYKVTMRFWLISSVTALVGLIVFLLDRTF
ncbi:hypothetical protein HY933_04165 [Candidatus Falkowbacteria bacterium]|nr:hypothetical protein [Candidatus Falkowbacteria bacterium]